MSSARNGSSVRTTRTPPRVTVSARLMPAAAADPFDCAGLPAAAGSACPAGSTCAPLVGPGARTQKATAAAGRSPLVVTRANQSPPQGRRHHWFPRTKRSLSVTPVPAPPLCPPGGGPPHLRRRPHLPGHQREPAGPAGELPRLTGRGTGPLGQPAGTCPYRPFNHVLPSFDLRRSGRGHDGAERARRPDGWPPARIAAVHPRGKPMTAPQHHPAAKRIAAVGAVALLPLAVAASAGAAKGLPTWTAGTVITGRPDSGNHDNPAQGVNHTWASDSFTQTASVTFYAQVASSFCPGIGNGECYYWTVELLDSKGTFTTNPTAASGAYSPGNGTDGTGAS